MSFATPILDRRDRRPKDKALGGPKRCGRPSHSREDRVRTIAWFKAVASGLGLDTAGAVGRRMQEEADKCGRHAENHDASKVWTHYAKGRPAPGPKRLEFVDKIVPGTAEFFRQGPSGLWIAMWGDLGMQLCADDVQALFCVRPSDLDLHWLVSAITAWRNHAALAYSGALNEFPDGLYEAVIFGLRNPSVTSELKEWGVWNLILEDISESERSNIRRNPHKRQEIFAIGCDFSHDPVRYYLTNPIAFSQAAENCHPAGVSVLGRSMRQ